jgi:hypothetical protein
MSNASPCRIPPRTCSSTDSRGSGSARLLRGGPPCPEGGGHVDARTIRAGERRRVSAVPWSPSSRAVTVRPGSAAPSPAPADSRCHARRGRPAVISSARNSPAWVGMRRSQPMANTYPTPRPSSTCCAQRHTRGRGRRDHRNRRITRTAHVFDRFRRSWVAGELGSPPIGTTLPTPCRRAGRITIYGWSATRPVKS